MKLIRRVWLTVKYTSWNPIDWHNHSRDQLILLGLPAAWRVAGIVVDC